PRGEVRLRVLAGVPDTLDGVDLVHAGELVLVEPHAVEDVELALRTPEAGVRDPGGGKERLRFLGDIARVTLVRLTGNGIDDVASHAQGRDAQDRVDDGRRGIGDQQHTALVDVLEAANAR